MPSAVLTLQKCGGLFQSVDLHITRGPLSMHCTAAVGLSPQAQTRKHLSSTDGRRFPGDSEVRLHRSFLICSLRHSGRLAGVSAYFLRKHHCIPSCGGSQAEGWPSSAAKQQLRTSSNGAAPLKWPLETLKAVVKRLISTKATEPESGTRPIEAATKPRCISGGEKGSAYGPAFSGLLALSLLIGAANMLTPPAQAFTLFGPSQEKDPVEPFVIYGTVEKKFLIEKIEAGRIVGRKRGFTASVCAKCVGASAETPEFLGLPTGMKMDEAPGEQSCSKWEAASKDEACSKPCKLSCDDAVARQVRLERASTGYELDSGDRQKALRGCATACENECQKPGRSSAFIVPIRP